MKTPNIEYKGFVEELLNKRDLIPFVFEDYSTALTHREYILVLYEMLKKRPRNRELVSMLWDYVRFTSLPVPSFIMQYSEDRFMKMIFGSIKDTEKNSIAQSKKSSSVNHHMYKGLIYAVDLKTKKITPLVSKAQMISLGFQPDSIYRCVNYKAYTHKGHVFIRDKSHNHEQTKKYMGK